MDLRKAQNKISLFVVGGVFVVVMLTPLAGVGLHAEQAVSDVATAAAQGDGTVRCTGVVTRIRYDSSDGPVMYVATGGEKSPDYIFQIRSALVDAFPPGSLVDVIGVRREAVDGIFFLDDASVSASTLWQQYRHM